MNSKENSKLTERQLEVLELVANGHSNKAICNELFLSEATVKAHMSAIRERLQANNRAHAVAIAVSLGLVKLGAQKGKINGEEILDQPASLPLPPSQHPQEIFQPPYFPLTDQESAILSFFAVPDYPLSNQEIADSLHISKATVRYHLRSIYAKLGIFSETVPGENRRMLAKAARKIMGEVP